jgi:hypothetical protein
MHELPCATVQDRLEAFHDGELSIDERVVIQNHLGECVPCAMVSDEIDAVGHGLRDLAAKISEHDTTVPSEISTHVLDRLRVEEQMSMRAQFTDWFSDMHFVWAGLGATVATMICVVGSASVLHAASQERPNSMARAISVLASPGSNDNPLRLNYEMNAPRAVNDAAIEMSEEDAEYALSAVVSREGRVQGVEVINNMPGPGVNAMLNEAYRVQFAPATARGDAVAVSMVWLVANTTVKARHDETMQALRQALRMQNSPQPIAPLPIPPEASQPPVKPGVAPAMMKPVAPEASAGL